MRIAAAIVLIHAGWVKWFHVGVPSGVTSAMTRYGLPGPVAFAYVAATLELGRRPGKPSEVRRRAA